MSALRHGDHRGQPEPVTVRVDVQASPGRNQSTSQPVQATITDTISDTVSGTVSDTSLLTVAVLALSRSADPVVGDRQHQPAAAVAQVELAPPGPRVPQHVGDPFADGPGERLFGAGGDRPVVRRHLGANARSLKCPTGSVELLVEGERAHPVNGLPDLDE